MITTLISIAVFIAYGLQQAQQDKGGKPNDQHAPDWQERAAFALFVAGVLTLMHQFYMVAYQDAAIEFGAMGWRFLGLCLIGYGAFTPVFRWRLNRLRGMDARYISPSNWYDRLCMLPFVAPGVSMLDAENWTLYHRASYGKVDRYTKHVHRSGLTAYAVELVFGIIGLILLAQ